MLKKIYTILVFPYTLLLLYFMFFGFGRFQMEDNALRISPIYSTIVFIENNVEAGNWRHLIINIVGNIIMFIPFGFLGFIFPECKNLRYLMTCFLSVIIIVEALQYFSRLGFFDVDDIILNALGVWIGYCLFVKLSPNGKSILEKVKTDN